MFFIGFVFGIIIGFIIEVPDWDVLWNSTAQERHFQTMNTTPAHRWNNIITRIDDADIHYWGVAFAFVFWIYECIVEAIADKFGER